MIDTKKPIKIYDDRSKFDYDLAINKVLWENDKYALCTFVPSEETCPGLVNQPILIDKISREIQNSDFDSWLAVNYNYKEREMFISAILGHVATNSKADRKTLKELREDLTKNLPIIGLFKFNDRARVEEALNGDYEVRVYTRVAEAIEKYRE